MGCNRLSSRIGLPGPWAWIRLACRACLVFFRLYGGSGEAQFGFSHRWSRGTGIAGAVDCWNCPCVAGDAADLIFATLWLPLSHPQGARSCDGCADCRRRASAPRGGLRVQCSVSARWVPYNLAAGGLMRRGVVRDAGKVTDFDEQLTASNALVVEMKICIAGALGANRNTRR